VSVPEPEVAGRLDHPADHEQRGAAATVNAFTKDGFFID
jgi:hypothetical protein